MSVNCYFVLFLKGAAKITLASTMNKIIRRWFSFLANYGNLPVWSEHILLECRIKVFASLDLITFLVSLMVSFMLPLFSVLGDRMFFLFFDSSFLLFFRLRLGNISLPAQLSTQAKWHNCHYLFPCTTFLYLGNPR